MKVLILEGNLMWSPRLAKSVIASGHEPHVEPKAPAEVPAEWRDYEVAIVNLGELGEGARSLVDGFHHNGTIVIAHAGHKEKDLHALGREAGCDILATNGELTWKIEKILERAGNMHSERAVIQP